MRLIIAGGALIALQLARWGGFGAGNLAFGPGPLYYPMFGFFFVLPIVGIPYVLLLRPKERAGGVGVLVGAFLLLNDARLGFGPWAGAVTVIGGVLAIVDGIRTRSREKDLMELRQILLAVLAGAVTLLLAWYVIPLVYGSK
jgi:hypothetical protein